MIIERKKGGFSAYQALPKSMQLNCRKVGFICEAETISDAMSGVVQLIAAHCTSTGQHPKNIITGVESK